MDIDFDQIFTHADDAEWVDIEKYPYYKDTIILKATYKSQPLVRGAKKGDGFTAEDLEGGMIVQFAVNPLITSNGGVTFQLKIVKFVEDDGKRFGGGGFNLNKEADTLFGEAIEGEEEESDDEEEEEDAPFEKEADKFLGKGKKAKKKVVEEDEDEEEETETDDDDSEDVDEESDDEVESDSEETDESEDADDSDDEDEEEEEVEEDDDEEEEEEEKPAKKPSKKAEPAPAPKKRLTADDIRARAVAAKKAKEAAAKGSAKKSAIDRL